MSIRSMLDRGFRSTTNATITILSKDTQAGKQGLNSKKDITWKPIGSIDCNWIWTRSDEDKSVGERQTYSAICQVLTEELKDILITQECRILRSAVALPENLKNTYEHWLISTIHPAQELDGFSVIRIEIYKPKAGGNSV
ncbi:hypothetical protein JWG40_03865 [Leptospira sp. 201903074]|uniref:hypothetical protein n=1 Tax=Leptospira abararensis TaxID=2810036 RepID=UPI001963EBF1|nr:hypothetical protein [Leptospira abararensis]MBM9546137.1 hypothetical protein [Leptospira abararensis]